MAHKYFAKRTTYNGRSYASKAEARRAAELDIMQHCGEVNCWTAQPRVTLGIPENVYIPDFQVTTVGKDGGLYAHWEEVKGHETAKFKHDKKLWKVYGPGQLRILKATRIGWKVEIIEGENRKFGTV